MTGQGRRIWALVARSLRCGPCGALGSGNTLLCLHLFPTCHGRGNGSRGCRNLEVFGKLHLERRLLLLQSMLHQDHCGAASCIRALRSRRAGSNGSGAFPGAWARQRDATNITVCIVDTGLDVTHPDLAPNLWVNSGEIPGNGIDDDRNGVVDDINGFNGVDGSGNITVCACLYGLSAASLLTGCRSGLAGLPLACCLSFPCSLWANKQHVWYVWGTVMPCGGSVGGCYSTPLVVMRHAGHRWRT